MKNLIPLLFLLIIVSCKKEFSSEPLIVADPNYPVIYSVSVDADSSFLEWSPKNMYDDGTDTIIGKDSIYWSALYSGGENIFLHVIANTDTGNCKVHISFYHYFNTDSMVLITSKLDSGSSVNSEINFTIPQLK